MSPERWRRFKEVVVAVMEKNRQEWPSCLLDQCGGDVDLFLDASALLAAGRSMGDFIEAPAWHVLSSRGPRTVEETT